MSSTGSSETTPKATAPVEAKHAEQIPAAGPHDRDLRRQGVGVDDRGDGVGGVVEAVDEFEAERDQERDAEQDERQNCRRSAASVCNVRPDRIGHVEQAESQDSEDAERKSRVDRMIEMRLHRRFGVRAESSVECGGHEGSLGVRGPSIATAHDRNVKARASGRRMRLREPGAKQS